MKVETILLDKLPDELYKHINVIYGAGMNGKLLLDKLNLADCVISYFYDDDETRWGESYNNNNININIISQEKLIDLYRNSECNIIISSMYIGQIIEKLNNIGINKVYVALQELLDKDNTLLEFKSFDIVEYHEKLDELIKFFRGIDERSADYYRLIKDNVHCGKASIKIIDLYSKEKQYFSEEFIEKLNNANILDAGAYTGDTVVELINLGIRPKNVYCFEADSNNFQKLKNNNKLFSVPVVMENLALWNCKTKLGMKMSNYCARIDEDAVNTIVDTVTIDEYFEDIKVDFIKMDIEGSERYALGGGMKVIHRDKPILAISIYHGCNDMVDIPLMLIKELDNYKFFVRHYSYTYSETVLYGIPKET